MELDLGELLGTGGSAQVYAARPCGGSTAAELALKLMQGPGALERARTEAARLQSARHPGVVRLVGLYAWEGGAALGLERLHGPGLEALLRRGPLPAAAALRIAGQLAEILAVSGPHRDLKPAHLRLEPGPRLRLIDFGQPSDELVERATRGWQAPERQGGQEHARSEVWSVGALLYAMLTAEAPPLPHLDEEPHQQELRSALEHLPRHMRPLLRDLLSWRPDARPSLTDLALLCAELASHDPDQRPLILPDRPAPAGPGPLSGHRLRCRPLPLPDPAPRGRRLPWPELLLWLGIGGLALMLARRWLWD